MKNFVFIVSILLFKMICSNGQSLPFPLNPVESNWTRFLIKNVGSIDFPNYMEVQKGQYKKMADSIKRENEIGTTDIVIQTKGHNEFDPEGWEKYGRILINTTLGNPGDFVKLNFRLSDYTKEDILEMEKELKNGLTLMFKKQNGKIIEWFPLKIEKINGMSCIYHKFERQMKNNPIVVVNSYLFFNYDRIHTLTISYRINESEFWKQDMEKVLNSFRITNIRKR